MKKIVAIFMALAVFLTSSPSVSAISKDDIERSEINVIITEEAIENGTLYKEYHNSRLVDTLVVNNDEQNADSVNNLAPNRVMPFFIQHSVQGTKLGSVYYSVSGYSRQIRIDLGYKNGTISNTYYTVKNKYASLLALGVDIAAVLYMPEAFAVSTARKLLGWGIVKAVTEGITRVSSSTLSARAQKQYIYAYAPYQAPDQAELSRTLTGTSYTIIEENHKRQGQKFYSGACKEMWGEPALGINVGNQFFSNYFSIARWVKR